MTGRHPVAPFSVPFGRRLPWPDHVVFSRLDVLHRCLRAGGAPGQTAGTKTALALAAARLNLPVQDMAHTVEIALQRGIPVDWTQYRAAASQDATFWVGDLRADGLVDPLGLPGQSPVLSWESFAATGQHRQSAWQVKAASAIAQLPTPDLWDSGRVPGMAQSVAYAGLALKPRARVYWQVTVWDEASGAHTVSPAASFSLGLADASDWAGQWISGSRPAFPRLWDAPPPLLRHRFHLEDTGRDATLYATCRGLYRMWVNGIELTQDALLRPGWTDYFKRQQHQTFDVGPLLRQGENVIAAMLGEGWYSGAVGVRMMRGYWGLWPALLAQLEVAHGAEYARTVCTSTDWRASHGPLRFSGLMEGEVYDARLEQDGWTQPGFDDSRWTQAEAAPAVPDPAFPPLAQLNRWDGSPPRLVPQLGPSIVRAAHLKPETIAEVGSDKLAWKLFVADFGQNMSGRIRLEIQSPVDGVEITLRHGEALNPDGTVYRSNLRRAQQEDRYITKAGKQTYEPSFTMHGFRYVEIENYPGAITPADISAVPIHSGMEPTGAFECSDDTLTRLADAVHWTLRSNFAEVPTDCCQRNERLGWLGDSNIFARAAAFAMDIGPFLAKWFEDLRDAYCPDKGFSDIAPVHFIRTTGAPGWGDGPAELARLLLVHYGSRAPVRGLYPLLRDWAEKTLAANPDGLRLENVGMNYGDWLSVPREPGQGVTGLLPSVYSTSPRPVLATAALFRLMDTMAYIASQLGEADDSARYAAAREMVRAAYLGAYVGTDGRIEGGTQTVYAQALGIGLLQDRLKLQASQRLAALVEETGHLTTGNMGAEHILFALADTGQLDLAYTILTRKAAPSWSAMVEAGATTLWERWDGWTPEHGFQDAAMNSFNHPVLGTVGAFLFSRLAGFCPDPDRPGEALLLAPRLPRALDWVRASLTTRRGPVVSHWKQDSAGAVYTVHVPGNLDVRAELRCPARPQCKTGLDWREAAEGVWRAPLSQGTFEVRTALPGLR